MCVKENLNGILILANPLPFSFATPLYLAYIVNLIFEKMKLEFGGKYSVSTVVLYFLVTFVGF